MGDPIEIAALKREKEKAVADRRKQIESQKQGKEKEAALTKLESMEGVLREAENRAKESPVSEVTIKHRHHFPSHLVLPKLSSLSWRLEQSHIFTTARTAVWLSKVCGFSHLGSK